MGTGGAVVSAVALSLMMVLFPEGPLRVRAMAYFGFLMAAGGSIGALVGGVITGALSWRWVFLINIPVGVAVVLLALRLVPGGRAETEHRRLDIAGALDAAVMHMDSDQWLLAATSADYQEAVAAFFAKRRPDFTGD